MPGHLVVVHPGSACGYADFTLGRLEARAARTSLCDGLDAWEQGVIVIDGELSAELAAYPTLVGAITRALARASERGLTSERVEGDDPEQVDRIEEFVVRLGAVARNFSYEVTGAWYHDDGTGCVGSVIDQLRALGCTACAHESAVELPAEEELVETLSTK